MSQQTGRGTFKGVYGPLQTVGFGVLGELCKNGWTDLNDLYVASRSATSSRADRKGRPYIFLPRDAMLARY